MNNFISIPRCPWVLALALGAFALDRPVRASDHADPMSLNVFKVQEDPNANITDLHVFVVDSAGVLVTDRGADKVEDGQLIVSLCMRRALRPDQIGGLDLKGYKFRVHIDLDPPVRFVDESKAAPGEASANPDAIRKRNFERSAQALYGGIVTTPDAIAEEVVLEFELDLVLNSSSEENSQSVLTAWRLEGLSDEANIVVPQLLESDGRRFEVNKFKKDQINIQTGIFDDPFIFPRFFRRNVVGVVTSIPLAKLLAKDGRRVAGKPLMVWATTHKGPEQIDHVGRSLRTQLPRFGHLNDKHPSQHVKAITKVHDQPDLLENVLATFLSPLLAHRHYDSVPDVMIYDTRRPAHFPNGRAYPDDVAKILADAGETLLFELAYAESREFPRATTNDKPFGKEFPYLAERWTVEQVGQHAQPGTTLTVRGQNGDVIFPVPLAPDSAAISLPTLDAAVWRSLWLGEVIAIAVLSIALVLTVRSRWVRLAVLVIAVTAICMLSGITAPALPPTDMGAIQQPAWKLQLVLFGGGVITLSLLAWFYALGRRHGARPKPPALAVGDDLQGTTPEDKQPPRTGFEAVRAAIFAEPYYSHPWKRGASPELPTERVKLSRIVRGLLSRSRPYLFGDASRRAVTSRADLRWGKDRKGFQRLLHPNGICLIGEWEIDGTCAGPSYSGCFSPGTKADIIARYSTCCTNTLGGKTRSLSLAGKLFLKEDPTDPERHLVSASFITQEDLGGSVSTSMTQVELLNAPDVSPLRRGAGLPTFALTAATFLTVDRSPGIRQLYEIAELGKPEDAAFGCPRYMRLSFADTPVERAPGKDFREEILERIYGSSGDAPGRELVFKIEVSQTGELRGVFKKKLCGAEWRKIGKITFREAVASYNGDHVLHFRHPPWRETLGDRGTATGPNEKSFLIRILRSFLK